MRHGKFTSNLAMVKNRKLLDSLIVGFTANICCGLDPTGDVLVDIDRQALLEQKALFHHGELIQADIHHLPFVFGAFDTLIVDPPFSFFNRFKWLISLFDLTKHKLIVSTPNINVSPRRTARWSKKFHVIETNHLFLRLWIEFSRI
jgi:hypothetical protein